MIQSEKENDLARAPDAGLFKTPRTAPQAVRKARPTGPKSYDAEGISGSVTRGVDDFEAVFTPKNTPGQIALGSVDQIDNLRTGH